MYYFSFFVVVLPVMVNKDEYKKIKMNIKISKNHDMVKK